MRPLLCRLEISRADRMDPELLWPLAAAEFGSAWTAEAAVPTRAELRQLWIRSGL